MLLGCGLGDVVRKVHDRVRICDALLVANGLLHECRLPLDLWRQRLGACGAGRRRGAVVRDHLHRQGACLRHRRPLDMFEQSARAELFGFCRGDRAVVGPGHLAVPLLPLYWTVIHVRRGRPGLGARHAGG